MGLRFEDCRLAHELMMQVDASHGAGCCLHIAVEDGNVEDSSIAFCAEQAERNGHATCTQLAALMAKMSKTQRHKLYNRGYAPKGKSGG